MSPPNKVVQRLLTAEATASGTSSIFNYQLGDNPTGTFQITISAAANVTVQGRLSPDAPFIAISAGVTVTSGGNLTGGMFPEVRINWAANTGTIDVWIMG